VRRALILVHDCSAAAPTAISIDAVVAVANASIASASGIATTETRIRFRRDVLWLERFAIETSAVENLPRFVQGNHLEELLSVALSGARDTLPSFRSGDGQFGFRHDRSRAVEVRAEVIHPS
jgi:hypothetical protein